jgi:pimeloyl-ACP methyl ester carboxylesterase
MRVLFSATIATACIAASADNLSAPDRITVNAAGQQLTVWSRLPEQARAAVVLVHGRTWSARPAFDFESHSKDLSLLRNLAAAGFAAYAVDLPGYGASAHDPAGWLAPTRAAEDVEAVLRNVGQRHVNLPPPVLLGWSRGAKISALVATRANERISALILYAYNLDPNAPPLYGPAAGEAPAVRNTIESARSDFVTPKVASPQLIQDFVNAALSADPTQAAVCCDAEFRAIRPESIRVPTLLIHGARDPAFKSAVASAFFSQLGAVERRWVIVGDGDHAAHLEETAPEVTAAIVDFIRAALTPYGRDRATDQGEPSTTAAFPPVSPRP